MRFCFSRHITLHRLKSVLLEKGIGVARAEGPLRSVRGLTMRLSNAIAPSGESREFFAAGRVAWLKRCLDEAKETPRALLDFGCGDGATTPLLLAALRSESAAGIDVSAKSLEIARKQYASARITYEAIGEFQAFAQMDLAYCNGVFHHIPPAQRAEALALVNGALRVGGLFSFWENSPWSPATRYVMSRCAVRSRRDHAHTARGSRVAA